MKANLTKWLIVVVIPALILLTPALIALILQNPKILWWTFLSAILGFLFMGLSAAIINLPTDEEECRERLTIEHDKTTP